MNNNMDKSKLTESIYKAAGGKIDRNSLHSAANGDPTALLNSLNADDRKKLQGMLNNPGLLSKLLSDESTKKLLNELSGGGKNG